ncbi:MAG: peptide chain release factor N(5)-glutamine methyltransferase [Vicinamibacterales bacterium]
MPTYHELAAAARPRLVAAGISDVEAGLDPRILLQRLLGWDAARFFAHGDQSADLSVVAHFDQWIRRRERREPVAYITGEQEFWGLGFEVTPAVLIPRPETEAIVEIALSYVPDPQAAVRVADVCTGSGCVAVAFAHERRNAAVVATDVSSAALAVAARNAVRHGVHDRISFERRDLLEKSGDTFDLIMSNPPYVPAGDLVTLQPEVVAYEPPLALVAGSDGLAIIRRLWPALDQRLAPGGIALVEFGCGQGDAVADLVRATPGLELVELRADLQGIPRTAVVRRAGSN